MRIRVKRIYEPAEDNDGLRILVDRLWPRGLSRDKAEIDRWIPEVAPSHELRKWFDHQASQWPAFKERFFEELRQQERLVNAIRNLAKRETVTLLFAAKDEAHNNALALKHYLQQTSGEEK